MKLFTIGFTQKPARRFFDLLQSNNVSKIIDTRINNSSQLSGFAKGSDLKFFAKEIGDIDYFHELDFAPTKELLAKYRKKEISWNDYTIEYLNLLDIRKVSQNVNIEELHNNCLLCSEQSPEKCHRRSLAEYLKAKYPQVSIHHLQ
jgi:uncharacterized protein (DUF488 family)